jgi:hypothetical protein
MRTIFSIPKPFAGHIGTIQRNAIRSWTLLQPHPEIILFGDDEGTAEVARDHGVLHFPEVERNEYGTPLLHDFFQKAENHSSYSVLCYVNADIILTDDFFKAVQRVSESRSKFLIVGKRWDVDICDPLNFGIPNWHGELRNIVLKANRQRPSNWIDYFVFSKGLGSSLQPFAIGRTSWDNWLIWHARTSGAPVVDVSDSVIAIHQNHDYAHHPGGKVGVWDGKEATRNYALAGGWRHLYTIENATHKLTQSGLQRNWHHHVILIKREIERDWSLMRAFPRAPAWIRSRLRGRQGG